MAEDYQAIIDEIDGLKFGMTPSQIADLQVRIVSKKFPPPGPVFAAAMDAVSKRMLDRTLAEFEKRYLRKRPQFDHLERQSGAEAEYRRDAAS